MGKNYSRKSRKHSFGGRQPEARVIDNEHDDEYAREEEAERLANGRVLTVAAAPRRWEPRRPGMTIFEAIRNDEPERVRELIDRGADVNRTAAGSGMTPLWAAVRSFNMPIVQILLQSGADVNAQNDQGKTALMLAVEMERVNIIRELLAIPNIRVDQVDNDGRTAMGRTRNPVIIELISSRLNPVIQGGGNKKKTHKKATKRRKTKKATTRRRR